MSKTSILFTRRLLQGLTSVTLIIMPLLLVGSGDNQKMQAGLPYAVPGLNMRFVYVAPGSFMMGSNEGRGDEKPVHQVTLTSGYWIGKYEVTQDEYQEIMGTNPSRFKGGRRPVERVSWHDAVEFCRKLTARERAAGRLPAGYEYRLPTEAEWEFAARGGNNSRGYEYSGSDNPDTVAWYISNSGNQTRDVGIRQANELGIHDMSGNVWEWCHDWYGSYSGGSATNPPDATAGSRRVYRGGGWLSSATRCRVANRRANSPDGKHGILGFRVAVAFSSK